MKPMLSNLIDENRTDRYLREYLMSGRILSEFVLEKFAAWRGRSCVIVREGVGRDFLNDLRHGGFCEKNEAIEVLATYFSDRNRFFGSAIVFEHSLARPGDAAVERSSLKTIYLRDCVYFVVAGGGRTPFFSMVQAIHLATTADAFRAFVLPMDFLQDNSSNLGHEDQVAALAASVESIVVGAFDNESFLIWERQL